MTKNIILLAKVLVSSCCLSFSCCASFPNHSFDTHEAVLAEGMSLSIGTRYGNLLIEAGKGTKRSYAWDGETFKADLIPRKERWHGALGLYHPRLRPPHKNVVHMVVEEYQSNYGSIDDVIGWINKYADEDSIYRDDGLFVSFNKQTSETGEIAINILLIQILINGEKPSGLPGSQNSKIQSLKASSQEI